MNPNNWKIVTVTQNLIQIEVLNLQEFKDESEDFKIGSYLKVHDGIGSLIAIIKGYKLKDTNIHAGDIALKPIPLVIDCYPIGFLDESGFSRGGQKITIPPSNVELVSDSILKEIFHPKNTEKNFCFANLASHLDLQIPVEGDKFFSKHLAVLGSTGSGKSGTVAKILQEGIKASENQIDNKILNNSHIIIFDLHGEYRTAFPDANHLAIDNLELPYWLMNSEELEELLIESGESDSYNQISVLKRAVILNKKKYNESEKVNYDSPVFFSIQEVFNYINNLNTQTVYEENDKTYWALKDLEKKIEADELSNDFIWSKHEFLKSTGASKHKVLNEKIQKYGGWNGDFERFISRLETRINDERSRFLFHEDSSKKGKELVKKILGYHEDEKSNITILDLSGIPFEVLSLVVSLITRLIFDAGVLYKRKNLEDKVPFLVVLEEAHNYIPKLDALRYRSVRKSVERIAKEGRKYGISLMIVSQRPSEISETIFSQCNNFVIMRLTNPTDQQYVQRLMPDALAAVTDSLPTLAQQEAVLIGDAISLPVIVKIHDLNIKPSSHDVAFHSEWKKNWIEGFI